MEVSHHCSAVDVAIVLEYTTADQEMKLESSVLVVSVWFLCVLKVPCMEYQHTILHCSSTACTRGDVRLVGGETSYEGIVEICFSGSWVSVCDYSWNVQESTVVCRQLTGELNPSKKLLLP